MAKTPEGRVKDKVKKLLEENGCYQHWPVQMGMGKPTLDCTACLNGRYFAVETKAPGEELTTRQRQTRNEILEAGGKVFVIDGDLKELTEWLFMVHIAGRLS